MRSRALIAFDVIDSCRRPCGPALGPGLSGEADRVLLQTLEISAEAVVTAAKLWWKARESVESSRSCGSRVYGGDTAATSLGAPLRQRHVNAATLCMGCTLARSQGNGSSCEDQNLVVL